MEGIRAKITEKKPCEVSLEVEVAKEIVDKEREDVFTEIQKDVQPPGFRKGKAPMELVKKYYAEKAENKLLSRLVMRVVEDVLTKEKLTPVTTPKVHNVYFEKNSPLKFNITVETLPEFSIKDYKGIKLEKKNPVVTEEEVTKVFEHYRDQAGNLINDMAETTGAKSFVSIDYEGFIDDQPFKGGKATGAMISIERSGFIPGFAEKIIGMKREETKDIAVTFPSDYHVKEFSNKQAKFVVTLREIKKKILPELDDAFAKNFGFESIEKFKDDVRNTLKQEKDTKTRQELEDQLLSKIIEKNMISVPSSFVQEELERIVERTNNYLKQRGTTAKSVGLDDENMRKKYLPDAERRVRMAFLFESIAEKENISTTEKELSQEADAMIINDPKREREIRSYFENNKKNIAFAKRNEKIVNFLIEQAKIKEA